MRIEDEVTAHISEALTLVDALPLKSWCMLSPCTLIGRQVLQSYDLALSDTIGGVVAVVEAEYREVISSCPGGAA